MEPLTNKWRQLSIVGETTSFSDFLNKLFSGQLSPKKSQAISPTVFPKAETKSVLVNQPQDIKPNQASTQIVSKPPIASPTPQAVVPISNQAIQVKEIAKSLAQIRLATSFYKNAPKLFSGGNYLLSAKLATDILRQCGFPVPKEVELSIAACQIVASGGAAATAAHQASNFGAVAAPGLSAVSGVIRLFDQAGWIQANKEHLLHIDLATDAALIVASGGTNVVAWVKAVFDSYRMAEGKQAGIEADAKMNARRGLENLVKPYMDAQKDSLALNFKMLQEQKIGIFDFATQIAGNSAQFFPFVFPEIKMFFPPTAEAEFWYSIREEQGIGNLDAGLGIVTNTATATDRMSLVVSRFAKPGDTLKDAYRRFFSKWADVFLDPMLEPYNRVLGEDLAGPSIENGYVSNKLSLTSFAVLSMMPPYIKRIPDKFDIRPFLKTAMLTPYDFEYDDCITSEMENPNSIYFAHPLEPKIESGISYNGVEYVNSKIIDARTRYANRIAYREQAYIANKTGDIDTLLKDPATSELLRQWGNLRDFGASSTIISVNGKAVRVSTGGKLYEPIPAQDGSILTQALRIRNQMMNGDWRDIQNFTSVLSMMQFLGRSDVRIDNPTGIYPDRGAAMFDMMADRYPQLQVSIQGIERIYRQVNLKSICRRSNVEARKNIAKILNVPVDKLVQVNKNDLVPDGAGIFKTI